MLRYRSLRVLATTAKQARVVLGRRHGRVGELVGVVAVPEYIGCPAGDHPEVAQPGAEEVDRVLRGQAPRAAPSSRLARASACSAYHLRSRLSWNCRSSSASGASRSSWTSRRDLGLLARRARR